MTWITGSENVPGHTVDVPGAPEGWCHAVEAESGVTACGASSRILRVWEEVPWIRARMAGGELCPACVAQVEAEEHATV
jgi:hypothetical protein